MVGETPDDLAAVALAAARAGAAAIGRVRAAGPLDPDFKSGSHDMVTAADRAAEAAVVGAIRAVRPDDPILGEEGGSRPGTTDVHWLVDPLDGTANFVYGRADYAVSVGARVAGVPTAGAIVRPAHRQWVSAGPGGVLTGRDGESGHAVVAMDGTDLSAALVAIGMPYDLDARRRVLTFAADLALRVRGIRVTGCAAGDLASLALGQCDAVVGFGLAEWDVAAGEAIVLAAGGSVRRLDSALGLPLMLSGSSAVVDALAGLVADR
jgi:myo-inositol-1(or 4)-monophosphatase